jgi:hypothetical protein
MGGSHHQLCILSFIDSTDPPTPPAPPTLPFRNATMESAVVWTCSCPRCPTGLHGCPRALASGPSSPTDPSCIACLGRSSNVLCPGCAQDDALFDSDLGCSYEDDSGPVVCKQPQTGQHNRLQPFESSMETPNRSFKFNGHCNRSIVRQLPSRGMSDTTFLFPYLRRTQETPSVSRAV